MTSTTPDTQPGLYYVSVYEGTIVRTGPRHALLLGPFKNDHAGALAMVDAVRAKAEQIDPRACWYSFGTLRYDIDETKPVRVGSLNKHFTLPA